MCRCGASDPHRVGAAQRCVRPMHESVSVARVGSCADATRRMARMCEMSVCPWALPGASRVPGAGDQPHTM